MTRHTAHQFLDESESTELMAGFVRLSVEVGNARKVVVAVRSPDHIGPVNAGGGRPSRMGGRWLEGREGFYGKAGIGVQSTLSCYGMLSLYKRRPRRATF